MLLAVSDDPAAGHVPGLLRAFWERPVPDRTNEDPTPGEGLRERKKRMMRQLISDTATGMFLERGFDEVRVSEVADACGVSEKTVYNYFPTKESLLLDREEAMTRDIRRALGPNGAGLSPMDAAIGLITDELKRMYGQLADGLDGPRDLGMIVRFAELIERTPSLRAAQRDMMDRMVEAGAQAMAARAGMDPDDPEPQIAADALVGLWRVQFRAMKKYSNGAHSPAEMRDLVIAEVRRAARLIDTGLWSFGMAVQGANGREQLKAAAESANEARKQVVAAIKQARAAWHQVVAEAHRIDETEPRAGRPGPDGRDLRDLRRLAHHGEKAARRARRQPPTPR
jgi:AcrR family transcriptional regulator